MNEAALGVVFNEDRTHVLLIKRNDVPVWVIPGGGIDPGEQPEKAAVREVLEETGLKVEISRHVAVYTPLNRLTRTTYLYECRKLGGELKTGPETQEIAYFPLNRLPKAFFIVHRDWLQDVLKNKKETIHSPIWRVTYWELFKYFLKHPVQVIRFAASKRG
jgi:8-oxo-dGTP diphosphatase